MARAELRGRREVIADLRGKSDALVRGLGLEVLSRLMRRTPIDTGRARANWNVAIGGPDTANEPGRTTADVPGAQQACEQVLAQARAGDRVFITNSLPYIPALEDGHSRQAPAGMVKVTVAELRPLVDQLAGSELRAIVGDQHELPL